MTTFDKREEGFEKKFAHDEELRFKAMARRNRLLGEWAAELLGKSGEEAKAYALTVVSSDFDEPGDEDVMRKVMADIAAKGSKITEADVRAKLTKLEGTAREQLSGAYPEALDKDHKGTAG